jgi:hypothetical protein
MQPLLSGQLASCTQNSLLQAIEQLVICGGISEQSQTPIFGLVIAWVNGCLQIDHITQGKSTLGGMMIKSCNPIGSLVSLEITMHAE